MYRRLGMAALAGAAVYGMANLSRRERTGILMVIQNYEMGLISYAEMRREIDAIRFLSGGPQFPYRWHPHDRKKKGRRASQGRRAGNDPNVTAGKLQFYRGGKGALRPGPAYFTSGEWLAKMYGPVQRHRLYLRNPKFVTEREWGGFDSTALRFDPSPAARLRSQGYDSAVWVKDTPKEVLYNVYALAGTDAIKKPKRGASISELLDALHEATDDADHLKMLRRIAKRLDIDVKGLTVYQGTGYTEVYDKRGLVWQGRPTSAIEAKSDYIQDLIRQNLPATPYYDDLCMREGGYTMEEGDKLCTRS